MGEKFTPNMTAGAVVIILSVVLVTGAKLTPRNPQAQADDELAPLESAGD